MHSICFLVSLYVMKNSTTTRCFHMVNAFVFSAIRSRTPTSAGMLGITPTLSQLEMVKRQAILQPYMWMTFRPHFHIGNKLLVRTNRYFKDMVYEIAEENARGQCTEGHSCKVRVHYISHCVYSFLINNETLIHENFPIVSQLFFVLLKVIEQGLASAIRWFKTGNGRKLWYWSSWKNHFSEKLMHPILVWVCGRFNNRNKPEWCHHTPQSNYASELSAIPQPKMSILLFQLLFSSSYAAIPSCTTSIAYMIFWRCGAFNIHGTRFTLECFTVPPEFCIIHFLKVSCWSKSIPYKILEYDAIKQLDLILWQ